MSFPECDCAICNNCDDPYEGEHEEECCCEECHEFHDDCDEWADICEHCEEQLDRDMEEHYGNGK